MRNLFYYRKVRRPKGILQTNNKGVGFQRSCGPASVGKQNTKTWIYRLAVEKSKFLYFTDNCGNPRQHK